MDRNRKARHRGARNAEWSDDEFNTRSGEIIERNGNLTLVRDDETGDEDWIGNFQIGKRW